MIDEDVLLALALKQSGGGGGGDNNYNHLINRPKVNNHTLEGNMTGSDLGLLDADADLTTEQINTLIGLL